MKTCPSLMMRTAKPSGMVRTAALVLVIGLDAVAVVAAPAEGLGRQGQYQHPLIMHPRRWPSVVEETAPGFLTPEGLVRESLKFLERGLGLFCGVWVGVL
jgi:hypothetical protein